MLLAGKRTCEQGIQVRLESKPQPALSPPAIQKHVRQLCGGLTFIPAVLAILILQGDEKRVALYR